MQVFEKMKGGPYVDDSASGSSDQDDEEKLLLGGEAGDIVPEPRAVFETRPVRAYLTQRWRFLTAATVNTAATVGIVFTNKTLFTNPHLKHFQTSFAAFHFALTSLTLYILSRPQIGIFEGKRAPLKRIAPLAVAMILNVVLPNVCLAHSSVTFYQIARVLLTPTVAAIQYFTSAVTVPRHAAMMLVPVCAGVAIVSYADAFSKSAPPPPPSTPLSWLEVKKQVDVPADGTSALGVVFALAGVLASAVYTVWIKTFHAKLEMSSMQLLLNQAPVSVLMLLYVVPFADDLGDSRVGVGSAWGLILLSGVFACAINVSQFFIVNDAGPVSSTVIGHFKTCVIVALGWVASGKGVKDGSLVGIFTALGGIVGYSIVMHRRTPA